MNNTKLITERWKQICLQYEQIFNDLNGEKKKEKSKTGKSLAFRLF